jgi:2-polyprenyl-3-methyl-5-hydroxy-6-metoxy-1,4-benzoquinol methylase
VRDRAEAVAGVAQRDAKFTMSVDKAGREYWNRFWEDRGTTVPAAVDPHARGLDNYLNRRFDEFHRRVLPAETAGRQLLEIGCARSAWLPYFAKEFGFVVHGLDYSELGCRQASQVLKNERVEGEVVRADLFSPPALMLGHFDVVWSLGVLEHFEQTADAASAFSAFLRPGGLMITIIPNLSGMLGSIQKLISRPIYDVHVPLDRGALEQAHRDAGLEIVSCEYFMFSGLNVVNLENLSGAVYRISMRLASWGTKLLWIAGWAIPLLRPNRWTSPYVVCAARTPSE